MKKYNEAIDWLPMNEELEQSRQERREGKLLILIILGAVVFMIGIEILTNFIISL
jgi:flagellar basal body-associated protein FliL